MFGRFAYDGHLEFLSVQMSAVRSALRLKFGFWAYYPKKFNKTYFGNMGGQAKSNRCPSSRPILFIKTENFDISQL